MQFLIELLPLIAFFSAFLVTQDIFVALIVLMVAMPIGLIIKYVRTKTWDRIYLWSTASLLVFGAAALYFRNATFFYWKPTVFSWALGVAFLVSAYVGEKPLARRLMDLTGELPSDRITDSEWRNLNHAWVAFWALSGALNLYVAYNFDEAFWVNFKVFGLTGLSIVFILGQGVWLMSKFGDSDIESTDEQKS